MKFDSKIFILPGLGNSAENHWQSRWEQRFGFTRIQQREWDKPDCFEWIAVIDKVVQAGDPGNTILIGHSSSCAAIARWAETYGRRIKGALLVAPSDSEAPTYPRGTTGFAPMPLVKITFPSITVSSTNDYYVTKERAEFFASQWGSESVFIGNAGHINVDAGFTEWEFGLELLKRLDDRSRR